MWTVLCLAVLACVSCERAEVTMDGRRDQNSQTDQPRLYEIRGRVEMSDGSDPIGVQIFLAGQPYAAFADSGGIYRIPGIPGGAYQLTAQKPGFDTPSPMEIGLEAAPTWEGPIFEAPIIYLTRSTEMFGGLTRAAAAALGSISGRVAMTDRTSPEDVLVEISGTDRAALTNSGGAFTIQNLPPGDYEIVFSQSAYQPAIVATSVAPGQVTRLANRIDMVPAFEEQEGLSVLGRLLLLGPGGQVDQGVQGASVGVVETQQTVPVQTDGTFEIIDLPAGTYSLIATAPGFVLNSPVSVTVGEEPVVTVIVMRETSMVEGEKASISGTIILTDRQPGQYAGVTVAFAGTSNTGITGPDGRFTLRDVEAGTQMLLATHQGYKPIEVGGIEILAGEVADLGVFEMEPDIELPKVLQSNPSNGARKVVIDRIVPVRLVMNKRMRLESVQAGLSITPLCRYTVRRSSLPQDGPSNARDVMEVLISSELPGPVLQYNTNYRLTLAGATDLEGNAMAEPFRMSFTTAGLRVLETFPRSGAADASVSARAPVTVRFNGKVSEESLQRRTVRIDPTPAAISSVVQTTSDPATGWTTLFMPVSFKYGTAYRIQFTTRIRTEGGVWLDEPFNLEFRTVAAPEFISTPVP
ncbi:carboxypeptidase regulatory-like domain-containing protein [bacterium]|nr:carboxypeptidase regulatory-like domain-containing protein [bacterium]